MIQLSLTLIEKTFGAMYLNFSVKKVKQLLIMKIWILWENQKPQKFKNPFSTMDFPQIWCTRLSF